MRIRFIGTKCKRGRQKKQDGGVGGSSNWPGRVFAQVMIATAKEFPPSPGPVLALACDSDLTAAPQPAYPTNPHNHFTMGGGGKIPYPKHVWSPAGGWYAQPANWKANTAVVGLALGSIVGMAWMLSANREYRDKMPERHRFFPSRYWTKQIREHERKQDQNIIERTLEG
ncbi:hypothetical protein G6011_00428 [Alternaria panax]|uniref:Uncharacterized protein n=1 Tax=Alternaria panax TaxID=48097 RepID=A0AAD4NUR3_9PLEO|nr:hypothetical protein G6011_00428 [Alternaria panax]